MELMLQHVKRRNQDWYIFIRSLSGCDHRKLVFCHDANRCIIHSKRFRFCLRRLSLGSITSSSAFIHGNNGRLTSIQSPTSQSQKDNTCTGTDIISILGRTTGKWKQQIAGRWSLWPTSSTLSLLVSCHCLGRGQVKSCQLMWDTAS